MANVWYDINIGTKWMPYIGGGAGWARTHVDGVFVVTTSDGGEHGSRHRPFDFDQSGFAWQLGAGLNYPIQDGVNLGIGYRFFRGPSIRNDIFLGKNHLPVNLDNDNHSVLLSLTIDTN
jgi:OOP family OmpA-OmpF porin